MMTNRIGLMIGGMAIAAIAALTALVAVNWLVVSLMPVIIAHHAIFAHVGTTMGTLGSFTAIFFAYRQQRAKPEEPLKPRIRNGQIG